MAAPGRPNAWVMPSRRRISTAARAAVIRGMAKPFESVRGTGWAGDRVRSATGEALDASQQRGVVQRAVADRLGRGHQLGEDRADRDHHAGLAGGGGDDAEILVVQFDPEAGFEGAGEHLLALLVQDLRAGEAA